jgi:glycosyltransferase involved in cell wall biosynthesis
VKPPIVTVLIDTYNYGRFIEKAIDSVLCQDFPIDNAEIVVVDDGSTDDTAQRVQKFGSRIRYFHKQNGGQASALNLGFQNARGEIIALLDADDYFLPSKLGRIVEEFTRHPETGMIYHARLELDVKHDALVEQRLAAPVSGFLLDDPRSLAAYEIFPTSCLVFRRHIAERLFPIPECIRLQADVFLCLLAAVIAPVLAVPEPLAVYRMHGQNQFHADEEDLSIERKRRRMDMNRTIMKAARNWATRHRHELKVRATRLFLARWSFLFESEHLRTEPPDRLAFFWHVIQENYFCSFEQTWKLTAYNYLAAISALFFGYSRRQQMYEFRGKAMEALLAFLRRLHSSEKV